MSKKPKPKYKKKKYQPSKKEMDEKMFQTRQQKHASMFAKVVVIALAILMFIAFMPNFAFNMF